MCRHARSRHTSFEGVRPDVHIRTVVAVDRTGVRRSPRWDGLLVLRHQKLLSRRLIAPERLLATTPDHAGRPSSSSKRRHSVASTCRTGHFGIPARTPALLTSEHARSTARLTSDASTAIRADHEATPADTAPPHSRRRSRNWSRTSSSIWVGWEPSGAAVSTSTLQSTLLRVVAGHSGTLMSERVRDNSATERQTRSMLSSQVRFSGFR
jgi:hypothetical protein